MKKQLLLSLLILLCSILANAQTWQWAQSAGVTASNEIATASATDASGNLYVVGNFTGSSITFGSTVLTNTSPQDIFIVKYDPWSSVIWAKRIGGAAQDGVNGVCVDGSGNIIIAGFYKSNVLSFGIVSLTNTLAATSDLFVAKLDASGTVLWAKKGGGAGNDVANSVCSDASGNVYIAGSFDGVNIAFGTSITAKAGNKDALLAKFDLNGNYLWAQHSGGASSDGEAFKVSTDVTGNIIITGVFLANSINFGTTTLTNAGMTDVFISKYDPTGTLFWAKGGGGVNEEHATGISIDASGNAFITGYFFSGTATFGGNNITNGNPITDDIFLVKYDGSGNVGWARSAGSVNSDEGRGIATDAGGNIYIAGYFNSSVTFGGTTIATNGNQDIFIARYNALGNGVYAKGAGGAGNENVNCISVDAFHNAYIAGGFFSASFPLSATTLVNADAGGSTMDMFVTKLNSVNAIDEINSLANATVFPNPTNGLFTVEVPLGSTEVQVINTLGEIVFSKNIEGEIKPVFELNDNGVYFVRIKRGEDIITQKLIVNN